MRETVKPWARCLAALAAALATGCDTGGGTEPCLGGPSCWDLEDVPRGSEVIIEPDTLLRVGDTVRFTARIQNLDTGEVSHGPFRWSARDTGVLAVHEGEVVARRPGITVLDVLHEPSGTPIRHEQAVVIGAADRDTLVLVQLGGRCGVDADGTAFCWGSNAFGRLGLGFVGSARATATEVSGGHRFTTVHHPGQGRACGLRTDGRALCWGSNDDGLLGIGPEARVPRPTPVLGGLTFRSLHVGPAQMCGITPADAAYCWGMNPAGPSPEPLPLEGDIRWATLAPAGPGHTCGLDLDGTAYCWGRNERGQLGDGTRMDRARPEPVAGDLRFARIAAASSGHTCALDLEGSLYCWGPDVAGNEEWLRPTPFGPDRRYTTLTGRDTGMCAVAEDGAAYCWGGGLWFWSGVTSEPVALPAGTTFRSVAPGACGLSTDGTPYCWGWNWSGDLGNGTFESSVYPVPVVRMP